MVASGHRIIAEDALNLVESLSLSTPTHGHTLVTYLVYFHRQPYNQYSCWYNHRTTESVGSMKEPTNFLIYTACCCSASNLTFHAYILVSADIAAFYPAASPNSQLCPEARKDVLSEFDYFPPSKRSHRARSSVRSRSMESFSLSRSCI